MKTVASLVLVLTTCTVQAALAQTARGFAGVSGLVSAQTADTNEGAGPSIPRPGISGHAPGIAGEAGWFATDALSLGVEFSVPARFTSVQETHYFQNWLTENRHRDSILSAVVGVHSSSRHPVRASAIGGVSLVRDDTRIRIAYQVEPGFVATGHYEPYTPRPAIVASRFGVVTGGDVSFTLSPHVSLTSGLRLHIVRRDSGDDLGNVLLQMSPLVWRPAVGVRARF